MIARSHGVSVDEIRRRPRTKLRWYCLTRSKQLLRRSDVVPLTLNSLLGQRTSYVCCEPKAKVVWVMSGLHSDMYERGTGTTYGTKNSM